MRHSTQSMRQLSSQLRRTSSAFPTVRPQCSAFSTAAPTPPTASDAAPLSAAAINLTPPPRSPTGVVMLNMGGPSTIPEVGPFLHRLFSDGEIITLGRLQSTLGPFIARRRTPRIEAQYAAIGGSPIRRWTELQGHALVERLDRLSPDTAPHRAYIAFRYAEPLTEETVLRMKADGVQRAVAFSQYPQFSCTTTGSSLNHLWRELQRLGLSRAFTWSLIDRWPTHPLFVEAIADRVRTALQRFPAADRHKAVIIFSAHSLPMRVVNRGDPYTGEVAATVHHVMQQLRREGVSNTHLLAWQSQVGFLPWMGPQTGEVIQGLAGQGHRHVLLVPVAFTSDHVETLYEIDVEYAHVASKAGIVQYERAESLNGSPVLADAMAALVAEHLSSGRVSSDEYRLNCPHCTNPTCRSVVNPVQPYEKLRDHVLPMGDLALKNVINEVDRRLPTP